MKNTDCLTIKLMEDNMIIHIPVYHILEAITNLPQEDLTDLATTIVDFIDKGDDALKVFIHRCKHCGNFYGGGNYPSTIIPDCTCFKDE